MQRPVMDPMPLLGDDEPVLPRRPTAWREQWHRAAAVAGWVGRLLFSRPFRIRRRDPEQLQPPAVRFAKGVGYRLLFVPILLALAASALVYRGTHPYRPLADDLPEVPGVFYETVAFTGTAGQPLAAWFVPALDAKRVLELKERVFSAEDPVVVLAHDTNGSPSQMVPLVGPLHDAGYAVLVVGLRGSGQGRVGAQTFGLVESQELRAALASLRGRPSLDAGRVAIVGVGSGANAAVIAASQEPAVRALVLVNPTETAHEVIAARIGPDRAGLRWMQPVSKWAFEVAYGVDAEDLELSRFRDLLESRPTLTLDAGDDSALGNYTVRQIDAFLREQMPTKEAAVAAAGR